MSSCGPSKSLAQAISESLQNELWYWTVKRAAKNALLDPSHDKHRYVASTDTTAADSSSSSGSRKDDRPVRVLDEEVHNWLQRTGLVVKIKNAVYFHQRFVPRSSRRAKQALHVRIHTSGTATAVKLPELKIDLEDPLDVVDAARKQWDGRLRFELRAVANKQKRPLVQARRLRTDRPAAARVGVSVHSELRQSIFDVLGPLSSERPEHLDYVLRFVFTCEDLLDTIAAISNPNSAAYAYTKSTAAGTPSQSGMAGWGMIKLQLRTPSLAQLMTKYSELHPQKQQVGIDDQVNKRFLSERLHTGQRLCINGYVPMIRQYCKTGVPPSLRPRLWVAMMGCQTTAKDFMYYEELLNDVFKWDVITDDLVRFDAQHASDSDEFFVFEDMLDELMLVFSRDSLVPDMCTLAPSTALLQVGSFNAADHNISAAAAAKHREKVAPSALLPLRAAGAGTSTTSQMGDSPSKGSPSRTKSAKSGLKSTRCVPANQFVPFYQQTLYTAPLCYLFDRAEECYFLFRAMYARYFCRLHTVSSEENTSIFLAKMFEDLAQSRSPEAYYHALHLGVQPLRITFPWIFSAFCGYLPVKEVLQLWDRLLAYDSLELVSVLAAAIFTYRASSVLKASSAQDIEMVFKEISGLRAIPLLQYFLFATP